MSLDLRPRASNGSAAAIASEEPIDRFSLWSLGRHEDLLAARDDAFLRWAANYGLFPDDAWTARFRELGELKRGLRQAVGRRPYPWAPLVELRVPLSCTAKCTYCDRARTGIAPHANTRTSLLETIPRLRMPETIGWCAEWGDPCLHPDLVEAVNRRIENEWLVTRYTFLTNLSATPAVIKALPYTRTLLAHITMSEPEHASTIMGYRSRDMFEQVLENLRLVAALATQHPGADLIVQFIVTPTTAPFITAHYDLFKDIAGVRRCRYKPAWKARDLADDPEVRRQYMALAERRGGAPYDWRIG